MNQQRSRSIGTIGWIVALVLLFWVGQVVQSLKPWQDFEGFLKRYRILLLGITIGTGTLGFVLFMIGIVYRLLSGGDSLSPMNGEDFIESKNFDISGQVAPMSTPPTAGQSRGMSFQDEFTFDAFKDVLRKGDWRRNSRWSGNLIILMGVLLLTLGLFGWPVVVGPPFIKLLCGGGVLFAMARLSWALWWA